MSDETLMNRAIVNLRHEPLAEVAGWDRLHIICGDAGMSQMSTFLRVGTMSLVVEMLELGALPDIDYDTAQVSSDIRRLSRQTADWQLLGVRRGPKAALELLGCYLDAAKNLFSHRDAVTNVILAVWEDTLERLAENPMGLWRRLDWVAKLTLLETFKREVAGCTPEWLQSQDMEYHNLDPERGLYFLLRPQMERLVSDQLISDATVEPPTDTRAYVRGKLSQHLARTGGRLSLCANAWQRLIVVADRALVERGAVEWESLKGNPQACLNQEIPNPFATYAHLLGGLIEKIEKLK